MHRRRAPPVPQGATLSNKNRDSSLYESSIRTNRGPRFQPLHLLAQPRVHKVPQIENQNRQIILHAQRYGVLSMTAITAAEKFDMGHLFEHLGVWILFGIRFIDAVDFRRFDHHFCANFRLATGGCIWKSRGSLSQR